MSEQSVAEDHVRKSQLLSEKTDDDKSVVANDTFKLPTNMSKRQLKMVKKREKWLQRKVEKRLGISSIARMQYNTIFTTL